MNEANQPGLPKSQIGYSTLLKQYAPMMAGEIPEEFLQEYATNFVLDCLSTARPEFYITMLTNLASNGSRDSLLNVLPYLKVTDKATYSALKAQLASIRQNVQVRSLAELIDAMLAFDALDDTAEEEPQEL